MVKWPKNETGYNLLKLHLQALLLRKIAHPCPAILSNFFEIFLPWIESKGTATRVFPLSPNLSINFQEDVLVAKLKRDILKFV